MWIGGTTSGRGHNEPYGSFWYSGARWFAHRWAAAFIHEFDITNLQVDHCCPHGPSTLCVEHVKPEPADMNRALQSQCQHRAFQDLATKRHWLFISKGIEPYQSIERDVSDIPFYSPPAWLKLFLNEEIPSECPF